MAVELGDQRVDRLTSLIKDSFRVRPNQDPVYVDLSGNLARVRSKQHQVIFGRRGSGKSCLLVHFHRTVAREDQTLSIYIESDDLKRLGYPDVLIRLLLRITEEVADATRGKVARLFGVRRSPLWQQANVLRELLNLAEESEVTKESHQERNRGIEGGIAGYGATGTLSATSTAGEGLTSSFRAEKLAELEKRIPDFKQALQDEFETTKFRSGAVIVDDFYLFSREIQPDVLDYLHRLLRGTDLYLKLGTVRHRTTLMRTNGQEIGIDPAEDVEQINLDRTFEHVDETKEFLELMLNSMAKKVGIESANEFISADGLLQLTLASGGVPRDYLNTLVEAVPAARGLGQQRVTPRSIYKGAGRLAYRNKLANLRKDAGDDASPIERVFTDLATFCLKEEKKTGFLISQEEVMTNPDQHEIIQQLMDFKLIHVIEPDTSAASGRGGRFEAYTLDFSLFMEPRLRGIRHIKFWKTDERRRREGVREAPHYSLARAALAATRAVTEPTETMLEGLQNDIGEESEGGFERPDDTLF
jgi:hypothetical protein